MRWNVIVLTMWSTVLLFGSQHMNVSICNPGGVTESLASKARGEAEEVFRSAGVEIVWCDCGEFPSPEAQVREPWFIIRLRTDITPKAAGPASLDVMGRAFVAETGGGAMADAYVPAVRSFAERHQADIGLLLGFVIAHELGHLLLGPGHASDGVMRTGWSRKETEALRQRWLKFNAEGAARVRLALQGRTAPAEQ